MKLDLLIMQSMDNPTLCTVDILFSEIPVIKQVSKRIEGPPVPLSYGLLLAHNIGQHFNGIIPVKLCIDECFRDEIDRSSEEKAAATANSNRPGAGETSSKKSSKVYHPDK